MRNLATTESFLVSLPLPPSLLLLLFLSLHLFLVLGGWYLVAYSTVKDYQLEFITTIIQLAFT
jgi:hypothetical protein